MKNRWDWSRFGKAWEIFLAVMRGRNYVLRSLVADERLVEIPHPEHPGGCTREEIYFNASDSGTTGGVPVRPAERIWHCTKCQGEVQVSHHEEHSGDGAFSQIICPCGQINIAVNYYSDGINTAFVSLRNEKKIY